MSTGDGENVTSTAIVLFGLGVAIFAPTYIASERFGLSLAISGSAAAFGWFLLVTRDLREAPKEASPSPGTLADAYSAPRSRNVDGREVVFVEARTDGREFTIARVTCDAEIVFSVVPRSDASSGTEYIQTNDAFDARYAVEGAPREVVRSLLDNELRRVLLQNHPLRARLSRLHWKPMGARQMPLGWLELVVDGWSKEESLGFVATLLASRIEDAVAHRRVGSYRGSFEVLKRQENEEEVTAFEAAVAQR